MARDYEHTGYHSPVDTPPFTFPPPMKPRKKQQGASWVVILFTVTAIILGIVAGLTVRGLLNSI